MDHFERLGFPRRFDLMDAEIEKQYLARSRELHPDFHTQASSAEQQASLELSSSLNEAYWILKDPFRRGDYLLQLLGGPPPGSLKEVPQAFLMEMLDLREEIETVKVSKSENAFQKMESELESRRDALFQQIAKQFAANGELKKIRETLNAAKYLVNLLRDLRD
jgi:molecular chaperone HscB